jgi:hypothetical protein
MKHSFIFLVGIILGLTLLSSCAKYDYHSQMEIADETETLDMHDNVAG